jgi:HD superfamily phosphohydrolase
MASRPKPKKKHSGELQPSCVPASSVSFTPTMPRKIVVDNIHGEIELTEHEWRVVNTATFQRLRSLKQLGMGHLVYPNATHNRFAHSLGVFGIMRRILAKLREQGKPLSSADEENLRLAALLHDVGHYPYSHLMERVDFVQLTEEEIGIGSHEASASRIPYPDHEELGRKLLQHQADIREAVGGVGRAREIGALFSRLEVADPQLSKLIHSSLDMDRLDYLLRDARAAGVPYGEIDLNYLLSNIRISPKGVLGVESKALAAAEHFLLARHFMHRVVYYHKTIYGFEEACRQLLRRVRDSKRYDIAADGEAILQLCQGEQFTSFTDDYVDSIVHKAANDGSDDVIRTLARCIASRIPPKLLGEVSGLQKKGHDFHQGSFFKTRCRSDLAELARKFDIPVGQFLLCGPKPIKLEERSALLTRAEAEKLKPEEREELIKVFPPGSDEPKSIVEIDDTVVKHLSDHSFGIHRLYVADVSEKAATRLPEMKEVVQKWMRP